MQANRVSSLLIILAFVAISIAAAEDNALDDIHMDIEADYDNVSHVSADDFELLTPEHRVVFDVREADEFAVSHIEGAIRIAPDITVAQFEQRYAALLQDKTVVFYCSVGRRSSALAERVSKTVQTHSASPAFNLIGGVFRWSNERRPLVGADGATDSVHPYNRYWGRLIEDKSTIAFE